MKMSNLLQIYFFNAQIILIFCGLL